MIQILSLNAGKPEKLVDHRGKDFISSVHRPLASGPVKVTFRGIDQDGCEWEGHRTPDRALCFYSEEAYQSLEKHYGKRSPDPPLGKTC